MKFFKWVAFIIVYIVMIIKEYGFQAFINAYRETNKIVKLFNQAGK